MNIKLSFLRGMIVASVVILAGAITISACEDVRIGKTRKELAREMFEVDSLIKKIQLDLDSTNIDFQKIYIDAQRINNGH